jgi:hypothetical protein
MWLVLTRVVELVAAFAFLICALVAFAHSRIASAEIKGLRRLVDQNLLDDKSTFDAQYRALRYLLTTVPADALSRQARWLHAYYSTLRLIRSLLGNVACINREMRRIVAFEAARYVEALSRLNAN